jgi:hypothetical protein
MRPIRTTAFPGGRGGPRGSAALAAAALAAVLAAAVPAWAEPPDGLPAARLSRLLSALPDEGAVPDEVPPAPDPAEALGSDEEGKRRVQSREEMERELEREQERTYQAVEQFAKKKLSNMRFCFSLYSHLYREIKEGTAGWGHWDDLFASGVLATRVHAGESSFWVPTGGAEIGYICTPLYQVTFGFSADLYTGRHWLGNEFEDLRITSYSIGLKFNLLNEYTALQEFAEMFNFEQPKHITGVNIYLRGWAALCIIEPVLYEGAFLPPGQEKAHYFKHGTTLGTFIGAGFEYRLFTIGLFFEAGYSEIRHPPIDPVLVKANHFRTFPIQAGINVYFGG